MGHLKMAGLALAAGLAGAVMQTGGATAIGICKCDSKTGFEPACLSICKEANEKTSFFRPAVYFGDDLKVNGDKNPLNGTSLKFLYLSKPTRAGMEAFRQYLEKHRAAAEKAFQRAKRQYKSGKLDKAGLEKAVKKRDEALVNYYHGMRAYITIPSPR